MGLIQRIIEAEGISTISVSLSKAITEKIRPPRAVFPGFPLGHPLGYPGQKDQHIQLLRLLLKYLEEIDSTGTLMEMDPALIHLPPKPRTGE